MRKLLLVSTVFVLSCAHTDNAAPASSENAPPPGEGAGQPPPDDNSPVVTPKETPWDQMTPQQQRRYMGKVVVPKFRELFQQFDPKHFEKVNCGTCHGKDPKEKHFKMPNEELPVLPASEKEFMATVMKDKPEMVKFMAEVVTPAMAELMNEKPFNPAAPDPKAFSCHNCHTTKGKPD